MIILFVDICGIDDHHCLNVLFIFNLHSWSYTTIHYIIIIKECNGDSTENDGGYRACYEGSVCLFVCLVVFNATFNNISVISWRSVSLVEETGGPRENHRSVASHWQNLVRIKSYIILLYIMNSHISFCYTPRTSIYHFVLYHEQSYIILLYTKNSHISFCYILRTVIYHFAIY